MLQCGNRYTLGSHRLFRNKLSRNENIGSGLIFFFLPTVITILFFIYYKDHENSYSTLTIQLFLNQQEDSLIFTQKQVQFRNFFCYFYRCKLWEAEPTRRGGGPQELFMLHKTSTHHLLMAKLQLFLLNYDRGISDDYSRSHPGVPIYNI